MSEVPVEELLSRALLKEKPVVIIESEREDDE
jgi:hypothetical protein